RIYYLLHIKPSKFDRARVIPIGDGLGRVLAEIIRHVKRFYNSESVPVCDHWDLQEKRPRPPAPYLIQGIRHPSTAGIQTIRSRIREISIDAGARRSDGSPLVLLPHDCRRVFASEHLNNNTPVHVIQALLGHASPETAMIYAKLYPNQLIEEYRKAVRGLYNAYYGEDGLKNPTAEEWAAFAAYFEIEVLKPGSGLRNTRSRFTGNPEIEVQPCPTASTGFHSGVRTASS